MQISKRTQEILKNYFTINPSIVVSKGNKLKTMAIARNLVAEAKVEETFPVDFAIYNLNEFLATLSLFEDPDLEFSEKFVTIREKGAKKGGVKYFYSNKALIVHPTKDIAMPDEITVEFNLTEAILTKISRAAGVLGVNDVVLVGDSEGISFIVKDKSKDSSNDYEVQISDKSVADFTFFFKQENMKFMPGDYAVKISPRGISSFKAADGNLEYAVALEKA